MRLLIVDDEPVIRRGLVKMAEQHPSSFEDIHTAGNGVQALELIKEYEPSIVFTDIRMPKMDGLELCKQIHEQYEAISTVVISGFGDFAYAQQCLTYGVKHYLLKPVTRPDVHQVLDSLLKTTGKGYVSISKYVDWVEQMETCIWMLDREQLKRLTEEFKQYCHSAGMKTSQWEDFLQDCLNMLMKRLKTRESTPNWVFVEEARLHSKEKAFASFEQKLWGMMEELALKRTGNYKDPLEEAKAYINQHLCEDISLEEVAEKAGFTPNYFSALFKKETKETFIQYRIKKRMEKAQQLLAIPHMRIVDVAAQVGYEDYPHFTKMFKKITGHSPSEFRGQLGIK